MKILVIEDQDDEAELLKRAFVHAGANVECVPTFALGMMRRLECEFDAIVLDPHRPDERGLQLELVDLKVKDGEPAIVVYTGSKELLTLARACGADDAICKSDLDNDNFVKSVLQTVRKHKEAVEERRKRETLESNVDQLGDTIVTPKLKPDESR